MKFTSKVSKIYFILAAAILYLFFILTSLRAEEVNRSERTAWEKEMAGRVEGAMEKFLGPEKAKVFIKAELDIRQTQLQRHNYSVRPEAGGAGSQAGSNVPQDYNRGISWLWPSVENNSPGKSYVLPGISANSQSLPPPDTGLKAPIQGNEVTEQTTMLPELTVKRLSAVIMVDSKLSSENLNEIDNLAKTILEIDVSRGDALQIVRVPFAPVWKKIAFSPHMLIDIAKWGGITASVMFVAFLMFLGLHGLNRTIRQVAISRTKTHEIEMNLTTKTQAAIGMLRMPNSGQGMPSLPGQEPQQALYQNTPESHTPLLEQKHFAFINGAKPETIAKILESEETETIALVLSCLDSNKTSVILNLLPKTRQAEIVLTMSKTDFIDTTKIKSSEEKLKNKLESLVEGKAHTIEMLSRINSNARDTILNFIKEKDPELAGRLEAEIFKFEDLATLTPEEVNMVLTGINHEEISIALRGMPQEFADTVIKALPKEAQKALRQWIGLGHPQPVAKIEEMRSKIVEAARKLEQEGRISRHISPSGREAFGEVV